MRRRFAEPTTPWNFVQTEQTENKRLQPYQGCGRVPMSSRTDCSDRIDLGEGFFGVEEQIVENGQETLNLQESGLLL